MVDPDSWGLGALLYIKTRLARTQSAVHTPQLVVQPSHPRHVWTMSDRAIALFGCAAYELPPFHLRSWMRTGVLGGLRCEGLKKVTSVRGCERLAGARILGGVLRVKEDEVPADIRIASRSLGQDVRLAVGCGPCLGSHAAVVPKAGTSMFLPDSSPNPVPRCWTSISVAYRALQLC